MRWVLAGAGGALLTLASALSPARGLPASEDPVGGAPPPRSAAEMYGAWCAACHGTGGKGDGESVPTLPSKPRDFSDCRVIGGEADFNLRRTIKEGGEAVGIGDTMPAFGEALDDARIDMLVDHLRTFCRDQPRWVRSELSFPRWLGGEKAFPENEIVVSPLYRRNGGPGLELAVDLRPWAATALELEVPLQEKRAVLGVKHALWFDHDRRAIVGVGLSADLGETPFFAVPRIMAGAQLAPVTLQLAAGLSIPWLTRGQRVETGRFAAVAVHAPLPRPYAASLAPGAALRYEIADGKTSWTAVPQVFWRRDETWAASVGAFLPLGPGDWRIMGYVTYEYIYPF